MVNIIAIYGPPCSGKTSLIKHAESRSMLAFDAEEWGDTYKERRKNSIDFFKNLNVDKTVFIGAADLTPDDFPKNTKFVNLLPPFDEYKRRFIARNIEFPEKAEPVGIAYKYKQFQTRTERFDLRITENLNIEETLNKIIQFLKENE